MNIYLVDDDEDVRASLTLILARAGHQVRSFSKASAFLSVADELPVGCVLLDLCLPDIDGLAVQAELSKMKAGHAIILLSGVGQVPEAVSAMRAGALDFLRKPYKRDELFAALERAEAALETRAAERQRRARFTVVDRLTPREREILLALAQGKQSKVIAFDLNISVRTVDMHRANILKKLDVPNISAALVLAQAANVIVA